MLYNPRVGALIFGLAILLSIVYIPVTHATTPDKVIIFRDDDAQGFWLVNIFQNVTDALAKNNVPQSIGLIPYMTSSSTSSLAYSAEVIPYANTNAQIQTQTASSSARDNALAKRDAKIANAAKKSNIGNSGLGIQAATSYVSFGTDADLKNYLLSIRSDPSVDIALHGFIHSENEFASLTYADAKSKIGQGKQNIYSEINVNATTFIPPYNTFNVNALNACKDSGINRFSSATYADNYAWTEYPAGLLHVPDTVEFYDYDNSRFLTATEMESQCQASLDSYNVCVILIHPEEFTTDYTTVSQAQYNTLISVIGWAKQKQSAGTAKLMNIKQYGSVPACQNQCSSSGLKQCSGNGVQTCGDYNNDTCFEWSSAVNCTNGQNCQNGTCTASCTNDCPANGSKQCSGNGYQTCGNYDSDSCLEWSSATNCSSGQNCSDGTCTSTCQNQCSANGSKQCSGTTGYQTCSDFNNDSCLEWSAATSCPAYQTCSGSGLCSLKPNNQSCSASNECTSNNCNYGFCCSSGSCGWLNNTAGVCITNGSTASNSTLNGICRSGIWKTIYGGIGCNLFACDSGTCTSNTCLNATNSTNTTVTLQRKITAGNLDAYEKSGTNMYISANIARVGKSGTTYYRAGFIFKNMTVPKGATIISAKLMLPYNWRSGANANTILYGEACDSPAQFTATSKNITNRLKTSSSVSWNNMASATWGKFITSPDVSNIVREVTGRSGWVSGNSIGILQYEAANATSQWEAVTYEGCGSGNCTALLEVKYSS